MRKYFASVSIFILAIGSTGCNRQKQASAIIFERKEIDSSQLLIKYSYSFNDIEYIDSAIMKNNVVVGDSILIGVKEDSPEKSIPMLIK